MNWYKFYLKCAQLLPVEQLPAMAPYGFWIAPDGTVISVVKHNLSFGQPPPKGLRGLVKNESDAIAQGYIRCVVAGGGSDRVFDGGQKPTPAQIKTMCAICLKYGSSKIMLDFPNLGGCRIINDVSEIQRACGRNLPMREQHPSAFWSLNQPEGYEDQPDSIWKPRTKFRTGD